MRVSRHPRYFVARLAAFVAVAGSLLLSACEPEPKTGQEELHVALLVTEGGEVAGLDAEYRNAAELVRREVSRQGGIATPGGRAALRVEVITHGPGVEDALRAMRQAVASRAAVVIGGSFSAQALPMAVLAEDMRTPFISPGATIPTLTRSRHYVFRTTYSDAFQAQALARLCRERGVKRVAVLFDQGNVSSRALAEEFTRALAPQGGQPPVLEGCQSLDQDNAALLRRLLAKHPDALFLPVCHTQAPRLVSQARGLGYRGLVLGSNNWELLHTRDLDGLIGALFVVPWHVNGPQNGTSRAFVERYIASFGRRPSSVAALVYDAFGLAFQAAARAPALERQALASALRETEVYSGVVGAGGFVLGTPVRDAQIAEITSQGVLSVGIAHNPESGAAGSGEGS